MGSVWALEEFVRSRKAGVPRAWPMQEADICPDYLGA